jgi:hypothetical protein
MNCKKCLEAVCLVPAACLKCVLKEPYVNVLVVAVSVPVFAWKNKKRLASGVIVASLLLPQFTDHTMLFIIAGTCIFYACKFFNTLDAMSGEERKKVIT